MSRKKKLKLWLRGGRRSSQASPARQSPSSSTTTTNNTTLDRLGYPGHLCPKDKQQCPRVSVLGVHQPAMTHCRADEMNCVEATPVVLPGLSDPMVELPHHVFNECQSPFFNEQELETHKVLAHRPYVKTNVAEAMTRGPGLSHPTAELPSYRGKEDQPPFFNEQELETNKVIRHHHTVTRGPVAEQAEKPPPWGLYFRCIECQLSFYREDDLQIHRLTVHHQTDDETNGLGTAVARGLTELTTKGMGAVTRALPELTATKPPLHYRCNECQLTFFHFDDLQVHKLISHCKDEMVAPPSYGGDSLTAELPSYRCNERQPPQAEKPLHRGLYFRCNECQSSFHREDDLQIHRLTVHHQADYETNGLGATVTRGLTELKTKGMGAVTRGLTELTATKPPPRAHHRCNECQSTFFHADDFEVHKLTAHCKDEMVALLPYGGDISSAVVPPSPTIALSPTQMGTFRGIPGENNSCYLDASMDALVQFDDGQSVGTTGGSASPAGKTHHDPPTQTFSCPVCFDEFSVETRFESWCGNADHAVCYGCEKDYLKASVDQGVAEIKCFQQGCEHDMTQLEIAMVLGHGNAEPGQCHPLYAKIDELKLNFALARDPDQYCTCPGETCTWTVARSTKGASEKATCGDCSRTFCTNCLDSYHYRATCIEWSQIKRAWQSWTIMGRSTYWREDAKMRAKAEERANREKERIERLAREEKQDEEWKAKHCRCCPHCGRIVEKLGGCNLMRCGYEPDDGGNVQDGCKQKFYWSEAQPYKAVPSGQQVKFKPTKCKDKALHEGWSCDECRKEIRGLRFECINCESWYICEQCDNNSQSLHDPGHCFRIHTATS